MRLTYVGAFPPIRGGIAQHGKNLVDALRDAGHHVRVYSWRRQYPATLYPGRKQRGPRGAEDPDVIYGLRWADPSSWVRTGRLIARTRPDAVLIPWVTPLQAPALRVLIASARGTKVIAIIHNADPHERQPFTRLLSSWLFRRLDGAVAHSTAESDVVRARRPDLDVRVCPHPPNLRCDPRGLPPSPPLRLLFMGYVRPYKGVDVLIDAVSLLRQRGVPVRLTIAGEVWGDADRYWRQILAHDLGTITSLRDRYVPDPEVPELLARHHIVVTPYRSASQSGVIPLAYAAGRPVVGTSVGGLSEQIVDGETGAVTSPGDAAALADAVEQVAKDLPRMSGGAQAATPTWRSVAGVVAALVAEVNGPRTPARDP